MGWCCQALHRQQLHLQPVDREPRHAPVEISVHDHADEACPVLDGVISNWVVCSRKAAREDQLAGQIVSRMLWAGCVKAQGTYDLWWQKQDRH